MEGLKLTQCSENPLGCRTFRGKLKDEPVIVKKLATNCVENGQNSEHWEKLVKLRYDHLVKYRHSFIEADTRVLVMDICQGSMLDYCQKTLDENVGNCIKSIDIMWQMTCGLEYLHHNNIAHGDLVLKNVLFWKKDSKTKRVLVKLTGYGYHQRSSKDDFNKDFQGLIWLFRAVATKKEAEQIQSITQCSKDQLTEITENQRDQVLELIKLFPNDNLQVTVETLLRHPLFTMVLDKARSRLKDTLSDSDVASTWNEEKLNKWKKLSEESGREFGDESFTDLKDILNLSESAKSERIDDAFETTPKHFSEFIWHLATTTNVQHQKKPRLKITEEELGKGSFGRVLKGFYTDGNGKTFPVACKQCKNNETEVEEIFNKEIKTLKQLNHLFVTKYIDVIEENSERYIVMELCEGNLKQYVKGELGRIPKATLDDKIIISQITLGLIYIHEQDIIHKDLKPDNILLWCHPTQQELVLVKIADFGFAKELKPDQAEFSNTKHPGTEGYMAPELLNAAGDNFPASFASDVFALGITIGWIALKGIHPIISSGKEVKNLLVMKGMIPQNIKTLSWELQDLILKLTDNDPGKRPTMSLVLRHPYFVLTNERTKWQFVDELGGYFSLFQSDEERKTVNEIFNGRNFEKWYNSLSGYSAPTEEDDKQMTEVKQLLKMVQITGNLYNVEDYERIKKEAVEPEFDTNVGSKINKVLLYEVAYDNYSSSYRLYKLIEHAPKLITLYIWSQLVSIVEKQNPQHSEVKPTLKIEQQQSRLSANPHSTQNNLEIKPKITVEPFPNKVSELVWSSFFYDKEELIDELWNIKYRSKPEIDPVVFSRILAKCNLSEKKWHSLMIQLEDVSPLLFASVFSHYSTAAKMTEMILKERGWPSWMVENKEKMLTPMHVAAYNQGKFGADLVKVLLENGGNPNTADHSGDTPVHNAARNESNSACKIMKLLLETGGDPNVCCGNDGFMPIHLAALNEGDYSHKILKELLKHGGVYDMTSVNKNSPEKWVKPIHLAASNKGIAAPKLLKLLIEKHQSANVISGLCGWTPLHYAVVFKCGDNFREILVTLFENGADPNACDDYGRTPLSMAVDSDKDRAFEMIEIILKNGGNPNAIDNNGNTPVHVAVSNEGEQAPEKLQLLLDNGGDLTLKNSYQLTAIHLSLLNTGVYGNEIRKKLPINEEIVNVPVNQNGDTLLHRVAKNLDGLQSLEQARILLENSANPNVTNELGLSPVHLAAMRDSSFSPGLLQLLFEKGGNPNLPDKENRATPIHYAALGDAEIAPELIKILIENKANPNAIERFQRTPLRVALENKNDEIRLKIVTELLKGGGNPNAKDANGETPVHYVVLEKRNNSLEMIKLLVENGGDVNVPRNDKMTPLNLIIKKNCCSPQVNRYVKNQSMKKKWLHKLSSHLFRRHLKILTCL